MIYYLLHSAHICLHMFYSSNWILLSGNKVFLEKADQLLKPMPKVIH